MTVEQVLIYLLAAIAGIFLFLGLAQTLDDRPPRPRRRRGRMPVPADDGPPSAGRSTEEPAVVPAWARPGSADVPPGPLVPLEVERETSRGAMIPPPTPLEVEGCSAAVGLAPAVETHHPAVEPDTPAVDAVPAADSRSPTPAMRAAAVAPEVETVAQAPPSPPAAVVAGGEAVEHAAVVLPTAIVRPTNVAAALPPVRSATDPDLVLVEDAMGLCVAGRHEELLARLSPRLAAERAVGAEGLRSHVMSALHCLTGLGQQATGDASAARVSFEAGVRSLPEPGSEPCPPRIAALSVPVARRLLEEVGGLSGAGNEGRPDELIAGARLAAFWLSWRLHAAPGDEGALALLDAARETVAESLNEAIVASIRRHEYQAARSIVQEAVVAGELPSARAEVLLELLGVTFRQEIDRLTAAAMRGGRDEGLAVSGLGEAEALLATMPEGAISAAHRAAVAQRIWRGHSKLGFRRLHLGELDAAADILFHALGMREIGRRRQRQVRDALVRALEGLGDQGVTRLSTLLAEGRGRDAAEEIERLALRMQKAREQGVSDEELEVASVKLEQLRRRLEDSTPTT